MIICNGPIKGENEKKLDNLCQIYDILDDNEKGKIIKLAEGLLKSQKIIDEDKLDLKDKKVELKFEMK